MPGYKDSGLSYSLCSQNATLCLLLEFVRIVLCLKGNTKTDNEGDNEVVNSHNLNFNVRQIY